MNLTTIGSIPNSKLKRIKGQYVAAVASVALAVGAVVAFAPSSGASQPLARPSHLTSLSLAHQTQVPQQYFYIVRSEAERVALLSHANAAVQEEQPGVEFTTKTIRVLVAGTPAAKALQGEGARELMAAGVQFAIIDMTDVAFDTGTSKANEADIAASVLSTELANFPAPAIERGGAVMS